MPNIDPSIPLSGKDPFTSLSSMLGTMRGMQQLQTGKILQETAQIQQQREQAGLTQEQGAVDAGRAFSKFVAEHASDPEYMDKATGLPNAQKFYTDSLRLVDPNNPAAVNTIKSKVGDMMDANKKAIDLRQGVMGLQQSTRNLAGTAAASIADDPDLTKKKISDTLDFLGKTVSDPMLPPVIKHFEDMLKQLPDNPAALGPVASRASRLFMTPTEILSAQTPSGVQASSGQESGIIATKPFTNVAQGMTIPGTLMRLQPGPATQVFNPATNQPELYGNRGASQFAAPAQPQTQIPPEVEAAAAAGRPFAATQAPGGQVQFQRGGPSGGVATGPKLGQEAQIAGTAEAVNADYKATLAKAENASTDIGILQNIKKFAPGAVTGVAADRQAFLTGIAGKLGMSPAQMEKTNTDLLAKNSAMLALAGGNTDLARVLAEAANPNTHMTPAAIEDAANQIIAQRKLALVKQQYMSHFKDDPDPRVYARELSDFNKIADPRILQLPEMSRGRASSNRVE